MFVFLALVFGLGFVLFGVGSGSTGIGHILQNQFGFFGSGRHGGGPSIGSLEKRTQKDPRDAQAFRELATQLQTRNRADAAITALERYSALRPGDTSALEELAGLYLSRASTLATQLQQVQLEAGANIRNFVPSSSSPLGRLFQDPNALGNPIDQAVLTLASQKSADVYGRLQDAETKAVGVYRKLAAADPKDAQRQYLLGQTAQATGDTQTAIAAYKRFLVLAPEGPDAARVKQTLKQLTASSAAPASTG